MVWVKKGSDFVVIIVGIPEEHRDQNKNTEPVITVVNKYDSAWDHVPNC